MPATCSRTTFTIYQGPEAEEEDTPRGTVNFVDFMSGVMETFPASSMYNKKRAEVDKLVQKLTRLSEEQSKGIKEAVDNGSSTAGEAAATATMLKCMKAAVDEEEQKLHCLFVACMNRSVRLGRDQLIRELTDKHARSKLPLYIGASVEMYGSTTLQALKSFSDVNGMDALKVYAQPVILVFITLQNQSVRHIPDDNVCTHPRTLRMYTYQYYDLYVCYLPPMHACSHWLCGRGNASKSTRARSRQCTSKRPCRDSSK